MLRDPSNYSPEKSLDELLEKFNIDSPRSFVATEMAYDYVYPKPSSEPYIFSNFDSSDYDPYITKLHRCLDFLDELYRDGYRGVPLQNQGGEILRRSLQAVADYYDVPSIWVGFSPIDGASGFHRDESESWNTIQQASYEELTTEEIERAEEFIKRFRSDSGQIQSGPHQRSLGENIRQKAEIIRRHARDLGPYIKRWTRGNIFKRILAAYADWKYLNLDESVDLVEESNYVFYPLQYYRESRVLVRAPAFYKQSWLVEYLSRSVPYDHELFAKDHPKQVGAQPKSEVDTIVRHSKALAPEYPVASILENASVVVVLNNTVGYEALLYGKPVVALGEAFYTDARFTHSVDDVNELPRALTKAIDEGGPTDEELIVFVHGLVEGSFDGEWGSTSKRNLQNLSISIESYYDE
ncbi:hypothetical protein GCM10008994_22870 [Halorubrum ejinorense]|uniref:Capsule polysaccharide biosynthesis protein n=1 Tax=Halorubrum ejinorense TaxID=425309 RepID=A0AAV3SSY7_9EURY